MSTRYRTQSAAFGRCGMPFTQTKCGTSTPCNRTTGSRTVQTGDEHRVTGWKVEQTDFSDPTVTPHHSQRRPVRLPARFLPLSCGSQPVLDELVEVDLAGHHPGHEAGVDDQVQPGDEAGPVGV